MSEKAEAIASQKYGFNDPELVAKVPNPMVRKFTRSLFNAYFKRFHDLQVNIDTLPQQGPAIILTSHFSIFDTATLMAIDPYLPWTRVPVKQEFFKMPGLGYIFRKWGAYPVNRDGNDREAIKQIRGSLRDGGTVCIAAQGTRSRTGRLGPMDETVVGLTLHYASQGVPVYPIVENGTYEALPPGGKLKLHPIEVISGPMLDLSPYLGKRISDEQKIAAAAYIQNSIALWLPERNKPELGTPPMWTKADYVKNPNRKY